MNLMMKDMANAFGARNLERVCSRISSHDLFRIVLLTPVCQPVLASCDSDAEIRCDDVVPPSNACDISKFKSKLSAEQLANLAATFICP